MARFDVYHFSGGLVLDVQADLVDIPGSRVVAPLFAAESMPAGVKGLHPKIQLDGQMYVLATHMLAATPLGALMPSAFVAKIEAEDITRALDLLFQGY